MEINTMKSTLKILLISNFLNTSAYSLFFPLLAIFVQKIDTNVLTISAAVGWYTFLTGFVILRVGKVEDVLRHKEKFIVGGYFLLVIGSLSYLFAKDIVGLFISQTINALGIGIVAPAWKAMYSSHEDKGQEAKQWSFFDGGNMLIAGMATMIGGFIVKFLGFGALILVMAGLQLLSALSSIKLIKKQ